RAAREAATLMEAERQARAAAEQAARDASGREAAERAAREAAELAVGSEPRRRRRKKGLGGRTPEEASAVQPLPSETEGPAPAPATFSAGSETPAAPMVQWQAGQSVDVLPAWARGAGTDAPSTTPSSAPTEPEAVSYSPPPSAGISDVYAPPVAEPSASILPFKPQPDAWMQRAPQPAEHASEVESRAVPPGTTVAPRRSFRINWARTLAASLLVALLEGVAFAAAWWLVTPEQQGWLIVHTKPAGIQISVDGMVVGKTPFAQALSPGRHTIELRYGTGTRVVPVEISAGVQTEQRLSWGNGFTSGQASISSSTAGAKVLIDGRMMGKTPLTVSDLLPGKHEVTVEGEKGTVSTMLMVEAGQTTELDVPVYAGWASVLSPVQLDILLEGKLVGSTEIEKLMLRPGKHTLELVNESLGYRGSVEIRVRPGATTSVSVVPKTPVTVEAPAGTELSINGENMGTLPNAALQVPLGTAEFVMRYKDEERRQVVPVTMSAPVTVKFELASVVERDSSR
ncbi:MAG: PEGA domain-containing protein, partial [Vicinamibacteraceae bacterium]